VVILQARSWAARILDCQRSGWYAGKKACEVYSNKAGHANL